MNTLRDQYKSLIRGQIEGQKAKMGALEDIGVEEYLRENPGSSREQALKALQEKRNKPIKGLNPNSYEMKFGPNNANSWRNKWG